MQVNANGTFKALGTASSYDAVITSSEATPDTYKIVIEGTIDCKFCTFEYMDTSGVWIKNGATITNFDSLKLTNGASGGTLLQIDEVTNGPYNDGSDKPFSGILFVTPAGRYNVKTNTASGSVTDNYWHFRDCPSGDDFGGDQRDRDTRDGDYATCNPDPPTTECDAISQGAITWALPYAVELLGWDCIYRNRGVWVSWQTEVELHNYKWIVERREKGGTSYVTVHQEPGYSVGKDYLWIDSTVVGGKAYQYRLADFDGRNTTYHGERIVYIPGGIDPSCCIPNPSSKEASIDYSVPEGAGNLRVVVYDKSGRLVRTLINEKKKTGHHTITWDGKDNNNKRVGSGIYFVKFELELANKKKFETIRKATLLR